MDIECLKKVRTPVRRAATDTFKLIENEINKDEDKSIDIIEELLAKLLDKETNLAKLDEDILNLCKPDDIEKEYEKQQEYKDNIITWKMRANKCLKRNKTESESVPESNNETRNENKYTVNLPRLQIPLYDGNILSFNDFISQFESAIDKNSNLSNVEKLSYLKSYLISEAEVAIRGLALTSENYEIALQILRQQFGRSDIIIDAHMSRLLNLNPVRKSYDIISLRKLYSECQTHIRGLENNGINTNTYGALLYPVLLKSIPRDLALEFARKTHSGNKNTITELLEFLKIEIECRERNEHLMKEYHSLESDFQKQSKFNSFEKSNTKYAKFNKNKFDNSGKNKFEYGEKSKFHENIPRTSAFVIDVKKCLFCDKPEIDHDSSSCPLTVEQRKISLRKNGLCFLCLSKGHIYKFCREKKVCTKCKRRHSELICDSPNLSTTPIRESNSNVCENKSKNITASKVITYSNPSEDEVLLETCTANINNGFQSRKINVLLDNASQRSFLKRDLALQMKLPIIRQESLLVYTFGSREPIQKTYDVVQCILSNCSDPEKSITIEALLSDVISGSPFRTSANKLKQAFKLKNVELSNVTESFGNELSLLIGAQYFWDIHSGEKEKITKSLFVIDTLFGKVVQGRIAPTDLKLKQNISIMKVECCATLNDNLTRFWQLESMGINDECSNVLKCDLEFTTRFENNLKFKNGRYETKLFWDEKPSDLNNNFAIAKRRFENLSVKLKDNWVLDEYKDIVKIQLNSSIVEECASEIESDSYHMPHSAVVRADRDTTKVRMVFDASSKGKGCKSLNDCLSSGPSLNPKILDIILRFRIHKYAFSADIQGAFLTIGIAEEDRDYLRFFWFSNENDSKSYKLLRMTRVPFGVTSSPFILAATIKHHIRKYKKDRIEIYEMLDSSLYVDDLFFGSTEVEKALELSQGAKEILADANMNLRKFRTNSEELRSLWCERGMAEATEETERPLKVLGIIWNTKDDKFKLDIQPLLDMMKDLKSSKRCVLQTAAKIYDPVGFISPFIVIIKCLLQEIWENGLGWDDELPSELRKRWEIWSDQISLLADLKIERKYFSFQLDSIKELELHIFSDASPRAFGAVAYFRCISDDGCISTSFVTAKSRIAPLKRLTLPRLELLGAVIASRIYKYLKNFNFPIERVIFWSDSLITLHWIKGSASRWKPFVSNRVTEIQSSTDPANWYHCSGKNNPADIISRGATVETIITNPIWFHGPDWLRLKDQELPKNSNCEFFPEVLNEQRNKQKKITTFACEVQSELIPLIQLNSYSNLKRLYRVTSWVFRFINNIKSNNKNFDELSAQEIEDAENFWIKTVQKEVFSDELSCLKQGKAISKSSSILELNPFLDDNGIIHVGGRLQQSKLKFLQKHPILMPSKHHFVKLIVWDSHDKVFHGGISETLTEIREKYWIIRGRQVVKNTINKCLICKRFNSSHGVQVTAPLPATRIEESPPFSTVGIDFGGPLYVKNSDEKHYIVIFTCAVTRALHLELVVSLKTETFLLALRRFTSRRGLCSLIITDNAKTFKRAELELKNLWNVINHPSVKEFYASHQIQWQYIAEKAAWWGGFYERLIRSVKLALRKTLKRSTLSREELETVIVEIEGVLNSRPLTYVFSDLREPVPLTPAHLLLGRRINSLPPARINFDSHLINREMLVKKFNYRERLVNMFWKKWSREYLLFLRSTHCVKPTGKISEFKVDDIVLVNDDKLPRHFWKMGRVTAVFPGRDGKIRSCEVKTNTSVIRRPVQLLYNLEINE